MKFLIPILCIILMLSSGCMETDDDYATISFYIGDVKKNDTAAKIGDILHVNDTLSTGPVSSCDIKIGDSIVRMKEKTTMTLSQLLKNENIENITLGLNVGKILCRPKKLIKDETFLVKTPTAVAGVRGTKFAVETDIKKTTRIKVFEGKVKVVKRVKQFENNIDKMLEEAPIVEKKEKIIVTEKEVQEIEQRVDKILKNNPDAKIDITQSKFIEKIKSDVYTPKDKITKFSVEDYKNDSREIIDVREKSKNLLKKIKNYVKLENTKPRPDGRLLITRQEVYFIKNGKVKWQGKVINPAVTHENKVFIASGDYVYCSSLNGSILWRKKLVNEGRVEVMDNKLHVYSNGKIIKLDIETGQE